MRFQGFGISALLLLASCSGHDSDVFVYSVPKAALPAAVSESASPRTGTGTGSNLKWSTPKEWVEKGSSQMRLASFDVKTGQGKGDASIVVLGGDAGGISANVNRWRGQAGLGALAADAISSSAENLKGALGDFQFFQIKPEVAGKEGILAAIFSLSSRTVFVKLTGAPGVLSTEKKVFLDFCKTLREANGSRE